MFFHMWCDWPGHCILAKSVWWVVEKSWIELLGAVVETVVSRFVSLSSGGGCYTFPFGYYDFCKFVPTLLDGVLFLLLLPSICSSCCCVIAWANVFIKACNGGPLWQIDVPHYCITGYPCMNF